MGLRIGVRRENKGRWERRVPLIPADLAALKRQYGLKFVVQPSEHRIFTNDEYRAAGVSLDARMRGAEVIFGVKEIPVRLLRPGKVYVYFAHVVKGQPHNMAMLQRLMDLGCSLLDYEKIADQDNRRLVFFGRHAGYAGMLETLRALGLRLSHEGAQTPLCEVRPAWEYRGLAEAKEHLGELGARLSREGLPASLSPLVIGITGYGNVSEGAQEVLGALPVESVPVCQLAEVANRRGPASPSLVKVVFREQDMVRPLDPRAAFSLSHYYAHPELYEGRFHEHLGCLDVLVNCIYWESRFPRLVTRSWAASHYAGSPSPRLKLIGDISCDLEGSIELTVKASSPETPTYVVDPLSGALRNGVEGRGIVIMAVDNLPCELSRESSVHFSSVLKNFVPDIAAADWQADFDALALPPHLKKAVIVHKGELVPPYGFLHQHLPVAAVSQATLERRPGIPAP